MTGGLCAPSCAQTYLGLDRNDYPGDANMQTLRGTFAFTGYWLNNPPGANRNSWQGKRKPLQAMGYGFLLLFNGREYKQLKASGNAARVGTNDATTRGRRLRGVTGSRRTRSSFSIKSKADECCRSSAPISMPGLMAWCGVVIALAFIVRAFRFVSPAPSRW